jgi:hypothetical protein
VTRKDYRYSQVPLNDRIHSQECGTGFAAEWLSWSMQSVIQRIEQSWVGSVPLDTASLYLFIAVFIYFGSTGI